MTDEEERPRVVLERSGFTVEVVHDGEAALRSSTAAPAPDLVLLDVQMPVLDGREVLRRIRGSEHWLPVILLAQVGESVERAMGSSCSARRSSATRLSTQLSVREPCAECCAVHPQLSGPQGPRRAERLEEGADDYLNKPFDPP